LVELEDNVTTLQADRNPDLLIVRETRGDVDVLQIHGEVDSATSSRLADAIAISHPDTVIVVDLTPCRYVDRSALAVLVQAHELRGPNLRVVVPERRGIRRIFSVNGFDSILHIEPRIEMALSVRRACNV
jgi:anti-anti-sigma factor